MFEIISKSQFCLRVLLTVKVTRKIMLVLVLCLIKIRNEEASLVKIIMRKQCYLYRCTHDQNSSLCPRFCILDV